MSSTEEAAVVHFLKLFESTADCDPTIVEFLCEQLSGLTESCSDPELFLLNEVLSGIVFEFEDLNEVEQNEISVDLLRRLRATPTLTSSSPTTAPSSSPPTPLSPPTPSSPTPSSSVSLSPLPQNPTMKATRTRRKRTGHDTTTTPTIANKDTTRTTSSAVHTAATSPSANPSVMANYFFSSNGGHLDQATLSYLLDLLNESESAEDLSAALPFIYANAPNLNPKAESETLDFLQHLHSCLLRQKKKQTMEMQAKRDHEKQELMNSAVIPESLRPTLTTTTVAAATVATVGARRLSSSSTATTTTTTTITTSSPAIERTPSLDLMAETFPAAGLHLLDWVLNYKYAGDLQEASLYLIDQDIHKLNQHRLEILRKEKIVAARLEKKNQKLLAAERQKVIERYNDEKSLPIQTRKGLKGCRPVPNTHDGRRLDKVQKKIKGEKETRWVDGMQMRVRKGTKKITVDQNKEEWDGGSRGKVTTKGKRGVGFR